MHLSLWLYRAYLRLPNFVGRGRIGGMLKLALFDPRPTTVMGGLRMFLDPLEYTQATLLKSGIIEPLTIRLLASLLRPGDVYVDVGAHVGFHTLVARQRIGPSGRVVAIEPQPYNCDLLLRNWHANGFENLDLYVAAAGAQAGAIEIKSQSPTDRSCLSLAHPSPNDLPQRFHVPMLRVDDVVAPMGIKRVRVMKIDAEGFEPEVLAGAASCLAITDHLLIEMLPTSPRSRDAILALHDMGFSLKTVVGDPLSGQPPEDNVWAASAVRNACS